MTLLMTLLYVLCFAVSGTCAFLLLRAWRGSRIRLLLWSGLGFTGIAINNLILVIDSQIAGDFSSWRSTPTLIGLVVLIWGLAEERRG